MRGTIIAILCVMLFRAAACAGGMEMSGGATLFREPYEQGPFVELLLKHSNGKSSGYDRKAARILAELSGSCYVEQGIGEEPKTRSLVIGDPMNGSYTLYVSANESCIYLVKADVTETNSVYVSKKITGLMRKGDTQAIEITYSNIGTMQPAIRKKVDIEVLKHELEIALIKGKLDKNIGRDAAKDLIEAERALANKANKDAANSLKVFVKKLEKRCDKLDTGNPKLWFTDPGMIYERPSGEQTGPKRHYVRTNSKDTRCKKRRLV